MSILVNEQTRLVIQGFTGAQGTFHGQRMLEYGTRVVAGMTPGKGGRLHLGVPVYDSVADAVREHEANASVLFVPPFRAADAILEAAEAGVGLIVCITEGIPTLDMVKVKAHLRSKPVSLIGPNTPGIISPGKCKVGIMPGPIHRPGSVGIMSRSGTLTYEAVRQVSNQGLGQTTAVGIGGDAVIGLDFVDLLKMFREDPETDAVVLIGEIGGTAEDEAAGYLRDGYPKPVVSYIAGRAAPPGRRMGHAGAIIDGGHGAALEKITALRDAGVRVVDNPAEIGRVVKDVLS
jgi:succinyl-CoA synthetase alpha subunit